MTKVLHSVRNLKKSTNFSKIKATVLCGSIQRVKLTTFISDEIYPLSGDVASNVFIQLIIILNFSLLWTNITQLLRIDQDC